MIKFVIPIGTFYWFCRFVTLKSRSFWEIFNWLCLSPHKPREIKWTSQTVHIILSQGVLKTYVCLAFLNNESYQICSSNLKHVVVDLRLRLLLFSLLVFTSKYFTRFLEPATNDIESYWELEYSKNLFYSTYTLPSSTLSRPAILSFSLKFLQKNSLHIYKLLSMYA